MTATRACAYAVATLAGVYACSAPANLPDLAEAENLEHIGQVDAALAAYHRAQATCGELRPPARAQATCADALLGEAALLDRSGRTDDALAAYLAIAARAPDNAVADATASYRAGELLLAANRAQEGWTQLWIVVAKYPDDGLAGDALRDLLRDARTQDPQAFARKLGELAGPLGKTELGDNLLWSLADLDEHELHDLPAARAIYDRLPREYPHSGLRDDARWRGAQVSLAMADPRGAVDRLRGLLATREVAYFVGSYFSTWLDDAQLLLGQLLRDQLHDVPGAIAAFRQLPKDYPTSILRDDALYELAVTLAATPDHAGACQAIVDLRALEPDSKYRARADAIAAQLACPSPAGATP